MFKLFKNRSGVASSPPSYDDIEKQSTLPTLWRRNVEKFKENESRQNEQFVHKLVKDALEEIKARTSEGREKITFSLFNSSKIIRYRSEKKKEHRQFSIKDGYTTSFIEWLYANPEHFEEAFYKASSYSIKTKTLLVSLFEVVNVYEGTMTDKVSEDNVKSLEWCIEI